MTKTKGRYLGVVLMCMGGLFGCKHAQTTGPDQPRAADKGGAAPSQGPNAQSESKSVPRQTAPKVEPGHPPLGASPRELRQPGGTSKLTDALRQKGYLEGTGAPKEEAITAALIHFQGDQKLAKTGFADQETLRKLGLKPEDVDKSSQGSKP